MKVALWIVVGLAGILLLMVVVGWLLPKGHVVTRSQRYRQKPEAIWVVITDIEAMPKWRKGVKAVKRLPDKNGLPSWVEETTSGDIALEATGIDVPRKMVTEIADPKLPFGGTWTYEIVETDYGTILRITENGYVANPLFRFLSRFVFGQASTIETYLKSLAKKFGEEAHIEG